MGAVFNPFHIFRREVRPPVDEMARTWIEQKLRWLGEQFGGERLIESPTIEPTAEFFPDEFDGSAASVRVMFDRVCAYMEVPPASAELEVMDESNRPWFVNDEGHYLPNAAGTFEGGGTEGRFLIRLERSELARPAEAVATMAHELAHLRLLGEGRYDADEFDNELLTDLTATFFGFGVFLINGPRHWHSQLGYWPGTDVRRPEYMTLPMFAYAMALISEQRFEEAPRWLRHLNRDARAEYRAAEQYLRARQAAGS